MNIIIRILASAALVLAIGCGGGSSGDSGANRAAAVSPINGNYEGVGTFQTDVRVLTLGSNTPPSEEECVGDISIVVDDTAADVLVGSGSCLLPANAIQYTLVGGFLNDNDFEGTITLTLSRVDHELNFSGTRTGDELNATFSGRTLQVGAIAVDWNGSFSAVRP